MITQNGILTRTSTGSETIVAPDATTWFSAATWEQFTSWNLVPGQTLYWLTSVADLGSADWVTVTTEIDFDGTNVDYYIYASETGAFAGEESETVITRDTNGGSGWSAFYGRYFIVGVKITGSQPVLRSLSFTASGSTSTVYVNDQDSELLAGDDNARLVYLGGTARLLNLQITAHKLLPYINADYWPDTMVAEPKAPTPGIVDKNRSDFFPTRLAHLINFSGADDLEISATFDAQGVVLPEQYWNGFNLAVRTPNPNDGFDYTDYGYEIGFPMDPNQGL